MITIKRQDYNVLLNNVVDYIDHDKLIREFSCPHCHANIKMPIVVRDFDTDKLRSLIQVMGNFMNNHPEIAKKLHDELMDELLDFINK